MNKKLSLALLVALASVGLSYADDTIDHTFFSVESPFRSGSALRESLFRNDRMSYEDDMHGGAVEFAVFGGRSTECCDFAKYFLPYNKSTLVVMESSIDAGDTNGLVPTTKDLEALHFNIETVNQNFESKISLCPRQSFAGLGFAWKQAIKCRDNGEVAWWFELGTPLVHVENRMCLKEQVINDGGGVVQVNGAVPNGLNDSPRVANMTQAFKQKGLIYGRIDNNACMSETRLADIELKLGYTWKFQSVDCSLAHGSSYIGLVIPTGNRPCGKYVFEPIVGNNHHWGIMLGSNFGGHVWNCDEHNLNIEFDINTRYLFHNNQTRSFNVYGKPFSRYMEMYKNLAAANAAFTSANERSGVSGINLLTKCVEVHPRFSTVGNTAFVYSNCHFRAEVGHSFFFRQAEKVCLNKWNEAPVFKAQEGLGSINLARTIKQAFACADIDHANYTATPANFRTIQRSDLDLDSAAHPATVSNTLYGTIGYEWEDYCYPMFVTLGGSYEWSHVNAALSRWTAWGKFGFSY